jgi:hypothetical protein
VVAACEALMLAHKTVRMKDGELRLSLSRPADSLGALPAWLAPVKCTFGHAGHYRKLILDFSSSTLACVVKLLRAPPAGAPRSTAALAGQSLAAVALLAIDAGATVALPAPFGRFMVKYLAGPPGVPAAELLARVRKDRAEVLAAGGFVDYVRDFDVAAGRQGDEASVADLDGDFFPDGVTLKCGGSKVCLLDVKGAAGCTSLTVAVTGRKGAGAYSF